MWARWICACCYSYLLMWAVFCFQFVGTVPRRIQINLFYLDAWMPYRTWLPPWSIAWIQKPMNWCSRGGLYHELASGSNIMNAKQIIGHCINGFGNITTNIVIVTVTVFDWYAVRGILVSVKDLVNQRFQDCLYQGLASCSDSSARDVEKNLQWYGWYFQLSSWLSID